MTSRMKSIVAGIAMLVATAGAALADAANGVVTVKSDYSVSETVSRIKKDGRLNNAASKQGLGPIVVR